MEIGGPKKKPPLKMADCTLSDNREPAARAAESPELTAKESRPDSEDTYCSREGQQPEDLCG